MIIWAIARTTFGDAMRKKVLQIFLVVTIGLIILSLSFSQTLQFSSRQGSSSDLMMLKSFGLGLMALAGLFISLVLGVSLIPQEIERRTIYTILAKPVKRYEFIIGKFLGAVLTLALTIGLMGIVFIAVVMIKAAGAEQSVVSSTVEAAGGVQAQGAAGIQIFDINTVWGVLLVYMQFVVLSSVVLMFSVFLTPTVNFFMGAGVYMVGTMAAITESLGHAEKAHFLLKAFYKAIYMILPNFDKYSNVANPIIHPDQHIQLGSHTGIMAWYTVIYSLIMMIIAIMAFNKKEV